MSERKDRREVFWRIRDVLAPTLRYSQHLYEEVLELYVKQGVHWLDIGCGHQILPPWRYEKEKRLVDISYIVVGFDYDLGSLKGHRTVSHRVRGDIVSLPFRDDCFDLVTANMVVEHLDDPESQLREVSRILRPGGVFIFHTVNALGIWVPIARFVPDLIKSKLIKHLDGREEDDIFETHYRANSRRRIIRLASKSGFRVDKIRMILSLPLFASIPPLAVMELVLIRILMLRPFRAFRSNIIAILRKE